MADTPDFANILNRPLTEIERPKPLPVGVYTWVVIGQPRQDKSSKKGTPFVEFTCKCTGILNDESVDEEALQDWMDNGKRSLTDATLKLTFYLTETSAYRLKDFLLHCGMDVTSGKSGGQVVEELQGAEFVGVVKHEQSPDGQMTFARITDTAPLG